jgi:hypothetical protein
MALIISRFLDNENEDLYEYGDEELASVEGDDDGEYDEDEDEMEEEMEYNEEY